MIQVYHNPRCSKSRECIAFLDSSNIEFQVINYLRDTPSVTELKSLIDKLGIEPIQLIRQNEKIWSDFAGKISTDDEIIAAMAKHPILIQRPIVINDQRAIIARPYSKVSSIL